MVTYQKIRLWRDACLGEKGIDLLSGRFTDHEYASHFHQEYVIASFTQGAQSQRIDGRPGVCVPGTVLIIPPGIPHQCEAADRRVGWRYRAFYPDRETVQAIAAVGRSADPNIKLLEDGGAVQIEDAGLARQLDALHRRIEGSFAEPLLRQHAFATAIWSLLQRVGISLIEPRRVGPLPIRRAIELMQARLDRADLSVREIAKAANLSPYHFMRVFRSATGLTVHRFLVQLRLQKARRLLLRDGSAVSVAFRTGFADQSHFIRHFRSCYGTTPASYVRESKLRSTNSAC
jgi:AraC-like DNA-binding protein